MLNVTSKNIPLKTIKKPRLEIKTFIIGLKKLKVVLLNTVLLTTKHGCRIL